MWRRGVQLGRYIGGRVWWQRHFVHRYHLRDTSGKLVTSEKQGFLSNGLLQKITLYSKAHTKACGWGRWYKHTYTSLYQFWPKQINLFWHIPLYTKICLVWNMCVSDEHSSTWETLVYCWEGWKHRDSCLKTNLLGELGLVYSVGQETNWRGEEELFLYQMVETLQWQMVVYGPGHSWVLLNKCVILLIKCVSVSLMAKCAS